MLRILKKHKQLFLKLLDLFRGSSWHLLTSFLSIWMLLLGLFCRLVLLHLLSLLVLLSHRKAKVLLSSAHISWAMCFPIVSDLCWYFCFLVALSQRHIVIMINTIWSLEDSPIQISGGLCAAPFSLVLCPVNSSLLSLLEFSTLSAQLMDNAMAGLFSTRYAEVRRLCIVWWANQRDRCHG